MEEHNDCQHVFNTYYLKVYLNTTVVTKICSIYHESGLMYFRYITGKELELHESIDEKRTRK